MIHIKNGKAALGVAVLSLFILLGMNVAVAFDGPPSSAGVGSGAFAVDASGNVSVGTTTFSSAKFRVAGPIESTSGGFIFPDGSTQTTASGGSVTSTPAGYVTPGTFNSVAGTGGNYTFPASISLDNTTSSTSGIILKGADRFIHDFARPGTIGHNTFVGVNSGNLTMTGASGVQASYNTAVGYSSLTSNTTGQSNTANGQASLYSNTSGNSNTAIGSNSLYSNTSGSNNTAAGYYSLFSNNTGTGNTASGYHSLYSNTSGSNNTADGQYSLYSNTLGELNAAHGYFSIYSNTLGSNNAANGTHSLYSNTEGSYNTADGHFSLYSNTLGSYNTAVGPYSGYNSGVALQTMTSSTFLGYGANSSVNGITNSTAIGAGAQVTKSNQIVIGNGGVSETVLGGKVGVGFLGPTYSSAVNAVLDVNIGNESGNPIAFALGDTGTVGWFFTPSRCNDCYAPGSASGDLVLRANNSKKFLLTTDNGGSTALAVTADDKVGIGTASPKTPLHIDSASTTLYLSTTAASKGASIILEDTDGAGCTGIRALNGVLTASIVACP